MTKEQFEQLSAAIDAAVTEAKKAQSQDAGTPEVSARAREAARSEIIVENTAVWLRDAPVGYYVQRLLDAAVAEEREKHRENHEILRRREQDQSCRREAAEKERNGLRADIAKLKEQLAAAQSALWESVCRENRMLSDYQELQSALAEKEQELAQEKENRKNSSRGFAVRCDNLESLNDGLRRNVLSLESKLSIERAAREKAEVRLATLADSDAPKTWNQMVDELSSLYQKLAQAEGERDLARGTAMGNDELASYLRAELARLKTTPDAGTVGWYEMKYCVMVRIEKERDAARQRCEELEKELAAVRVCFAEASQSAGPTTVHVDMLKAKCEALATALEDIEISVSLLTSWDIAGDALSQYREGK